MRLIFKKRNTVFTILISILNVYRKTSRISSGNAFFPTGTQLPGVGMDFSFISLKIDKVTQPFLLNEYKYTRLTVNPHVTVNYVFTYLYPIKS